MVGAPVTSAPLTDGTATVDYILPGGTPPQTLTIAADYSGATDFAASGATGTLTVTPATPTIESVLTLVRVGAGTGRVVSIPAGIACGDTCSAPFPAGATVELVAIPAAESTFTGWSGDGDCVDGRITLTRDVACTARFTRLTDKTTVDLDGDGLCDVIGYAPPPAAAGSLFGGRALLAASAGVLRAGDFNGDRKTDVFDYDPITGAWSIAFAGAGGTQRHVRAAPLANRAGAGWRRPHRSRARRSANRRDPTLLADRAPDVPTDRPACAGWSRLHPSARRRNPRPCCISLPRVPVPLAGPVGAEPLLRTTSGPTSGCPNDGARALRR